MAGIVDDVEPSTGGLGFGRHNGFGKLRIGSTPLAEGFRGNANGLAGLGIVEAAGELLKEGGADFGSEFFGSAAAVGKDRHRGC